MSTDRKINFVPGKPTQIEYRQLFTSCPYKCLAYVNASLTHFLTGVPQSILECRRFLCCIE